MSADNAIYVVEFPEKPSHFRVAEGSVSCVDELNTHWYTPEKRRDFLVNWLAYTGKYQLRESASAAAMGMAVNSRTEYGVLYFAADAPFGQLGPVYPEPQLSEGACPFCSIVGHMESFHGGHRCGQDPENPLYIAVKALQPFKGINAFYLAREVVEALHTADKLTEPYE